MSGSLSATGATSGLQMNSSAETQINADATSFDSLVGQGASAQRQMAAAEKLDSDLNGDLVQSFGSNQAGLSDASTFAMGGYADQLEGMMGDIGSSGSASALQQFAKTMEADTSQESTPTSALASPDSDTASSAVAGGSDRSGMMQMMQEMLQMLQQSMTMMQGSQTGGSAGAASESLSSGTTSPGLTQPGLTEGPALSAPFSMPLQETGLKPFISIPVHEGGLQSASTSGPQVTGNVNQDTQTLMSLIGGVGTNGNALGSFASALGKEAGTQGNSAVADWANNISGSLANGTYDQQGSLSAGMAAMQGKGVNSVQNNMSAILTQLESGQSTGSIANNLNALSSELKDAGRPGMSEQMSKLASGLENGSISKPQGTQLMQLLQELSKLRATGGVTSPETTTPTTTTPSTSSSSGLAGGLGPQVSATGTNELQQMMEMMEQMMEMMEMTQMTQGGLSQAA